jgi:hypothetical protein
MALQNKKLTVAVLDLDPAGGDTGGILSGRNKCLRTAGFFFSGYSLLTE